MNQSLKRLLFWGPRGLTILFMHLIPNMIVALILILAWRWEWIGAVLLGGLGLFYILWTWGRFHIGAYFAISGPLFVVALLFWFGWVYRREIRG